MASMFRKASAMTGPLLWCCALLSVVLLSAPSRADSPAGAAGRKLLRGVANVSTGWIEIFQGIYDTGSKEGAVAGVLYGPILGIGMAVVRVGSGLYDTVTFPFPLPAGYRPTIAPTYVWDHWDLFGGLGRFTAPEEPEPP